MSSLAALFLGLLVVGTPVLLAAIHLVLRGELAAGTLVALALAAMGTADTVWYGVGRALPAERLQRSGRVAAGMRRVEALWSRMPAGRVLFLSRFLYGSRIPVLVLCGLARTPYRTAWRVNLASSIVWLALLFALAASVGSVVESIWGDDLWLAITALVLTGVGLQLALAWIGRRLGRGPRSRPAPPGSPARTVSVIVPAYNEERTLRRALDSVRRQSVASETIVVENGSTDRTPRIAAELAQRVVSRPERLGYSHARNLGAASATGSLLVFLDADSEMAPDALEVILARTGERCLGTVRGLPDDPRWRYRVFLWLKYVGHRLGLYRGVLGGLLFCDARLFRAVGGFDEDLEIDELRDLVARARRAGGRYQVVAGTWSRTSMRRFEAVGLGRSLWFWIRFRLGLEAGTRYRDLNHAARARSPEARALPEVGNLAASRPRAADAQD